MATWYLAVHAVQPPIDMGPDGSGRIMYAYNIFIRKSPSETTAEELAKYLADNGVTEPIYVNLRAVVPLGDGPYIHVIMTAGVQPNRVHNRLGSFISRPGAQIFIRGRNAEVVEKLARRTHYLFSAIRNQDLSVPAWAV